MNDSSGSLKEEIWKRFNKEQYVFLATAEGDQPRVRPVTLIHLEDKLYVTTGTGDAKTEQIRRNGKTEFCLLLEEEEKGKGTIRAECRAKLVENKDVKGLVYQSISFSKEFWTSPDDPGFALIELKPVAFNFMKPGSIEAVKVNL